MTDLNLCVLIPSYDGLRPDEVAVGVVIRDRLALALIPANHIAVAVILATSIALAGGLSGIVAVHIT